MRTRRATSSAASATLSTPTSVQAAARYAATTRAWAAKCTPRNTPHGAAAVQVLPTIVRRSHQAGPPW
ncbi:hypothetical protein ACFWTE_05680 [Nocardiopsis sp. NPDC058631]|uniref:hypothetical protein n=1 Tax=Nocardiopsis sp. NPDC058631 TaxID=3346566 RepID=UPI00364DE7CF